MNHKKCPRFKKGVAIEMAIVAMMIIFALCMTMVLVAGFAIQDAKKAINETEYSGISDWSLRIINSYLSKSEDDEDKTVITSAQELLQAFVNSSDYERLCEKADLKISYSKKSTDTNLDDAYLFVKVYYPKSGDDENLGKCVLYASYKLSPAVAEDTTADPVISAVPFTSTLLRFSESYFTQELPDGYEDFTDLDLKNYIY